MLFRSLESFGGLGGFVLRGIDCWVGRIRGRDTKGKREGEDKSGKGERRGRGIEERQALFAPFHAPHHSLTPTSHNDTTKRSPTSKKEKEIKKNGRTTSPIPQRRPLQNPPPSASPPPNHNNTNRPLPSPKLNTPLQHPPPQPHAPPTNLTIATAHV